jgi:subtilisin family serine protease
MKREYTILRDPGAFRGGGLESATPGARAAAAEAAKIEVETLAPRDVREMREDPEVRAVAPVMPLALVEPLAGAAGATPAWGIEETGAASSRDDGTGITVAVLDTGIDAAHPAFQGVTLVQQDFTGTRDGDGNGHGTHCAGTVFGRDVSGTRIGVARGVSKALVGKVLDAKGSGGTDGLYLAMQWALAAGAKVISMSLGFDFPGLVKRLVGQDVPADLATSLALEAYRGNLRMFDAIMKLAQARVAIDGGAVVIAAAGNESRR